MQKQNDNKSFLGKIHSGAYHYNVATKGEAISL